MANVTAMPVITVANGQKLEPPSRVLFFPDPKVPCKSYIKSFEPNAGHVECLEKDCDLFHDDDVEKSSLMNILERLRGARQVDLCMYQISIDEACDVLISLHQSGTRVRVITDNLENNTKHDQVPRLKSCGIEVREITGEQNISRMQRPLMHNKFVVIDERVCFLGSFNWTWKALTRNHEAVIECHERAVVLPLMEKFEQLWLEYASSSSLLPQNSQTAAAAMSSSQNFNYNQRELNQQSWRSPIPATRKSAAVATITSSQNHPTPRTHNTK